MRTEVRVILTLLTTMYPAQIGQTQAVFRALNGAATSTPYYTRTVTIDHMQVGSTLTDFPVLVTGTLTYLKTVANGGKVANASGYDIGFYDNSGCSTGKLAWEVVGWSATTGVVEYHVKVPSVSSSTDTVIYLCYGSSAISTDQSNRTGTWDSNFTSVYHYPDGSTLSQADSTSNGYNGTSVGTMTANTGQIDGGMACNRTGTNYSDTGNVQFTNAGSFTLSAWVYADWNTAVGGLIAHGIANWNVDLSINGSGGKPEFATVFGTTISGSNNPFSGTTWHHVVATYNSGTGAHILYQDKASAATGTATNSGRTPDVGIAIGYSGAGSTGFNGRVDEVQISNVARSADWVAASYDSQKSGSTFITIGSEVAH